jgi:hypothetical protein
LGWGIRELDDDGFFDFLEKSWLMMILMTEKLVFTFNFLVKVELTHFAQMFCWRFEKKNSTTKSFLLWCHLLSFFI